MFVSRPVIFRFAEGFSVDTYDRAGLAGRPGLTLGRQIEDVTASGSSFRTTVDIPELLHAAMRHRAQPSGTSIRSLIVCAVEQAYNQPKKGS